MKNRLLLSLVLIALVTFSCKKDNSASDEEWLIPPDEVLSGGPGKDGIPSIDSPDFSSIGEINFLDDDDLVTGIQIGNEIKAYPHIILDWHEIINDQIDQTEVAITYCPLTGTGIGWGRMIDGISTTFGVSGLLYNTNLMPYDRATGSTWSQQRLDCVNGTNIGKLAKTYSLVETTWATWKTAFPESKVLNLNTGFSRQYGSYPYGDYITNHNRLLFPISNEDDRLERKRRVLGVINNGATKAYTVDGGGAGIEIIHDDLGGENIVVVRSGFHNLSVAFKNPDNLQFTEVNELPVVMQDSAGNRYDLFGRVVTGAGLELEEAVSFIGYWFSWGTFYPGLDLYED